MIASGTTFTGYIDGLQAGSVTGNAVALTSPQITLGDFGATDTHFYFAGQIDEVALTQSADYSGNYTPATAPFTAPSSNLVDLLHLDGNATDAAIAVAPLVVSNPAVTFTGTVPTLSVSAAGGSGTLTYQWARSTTPAFAFTSGTLLTDAGGITGSATSALTDASSLTSSTVYYYRCRVTDSASPPDVTDSVQRPFVLPSLTPIKIISIGDSQSARQAECAFISPIDCASRTLDSVKGLRVVSVVNAAVPGSDSSNWISGATDLNNAIAAAGGSLAGYYVFYRIGVNDAQVNHSAATYQSDLSNTISTILAQNPAGIFLSYSLPREAGVYGEQPNVTFNEGCTAPMLQFQAIQAAAVGGKVYLGDTQSYTLFSLYPQLYFYYGTSPYSLTGPQGAIHETQVGAELMGANEANALLSVLYPASVSLPLVPTRQPSRGR